MGFFCKRQKTKGGISQLYIINNKNWLNIWLFAGFFVFICMKTFSQFQPNIAFFPKLDGPGPWIQRVKKSLIIQCKWWCHQKIIMNPFLLITFPYSNRFLLVFVLYIIHLVLLSTVCSVGAVYSKTRL